MIHILDNDRMNNIGDSYHALSMSWFGRDENNVEQLKNNVNNCINNIWRNAPAGEKMWGTFNDCRCKISGKGYTRSFLRFNMKATNEYRNRHYMIYLVNLFMNVGEKTFYHKHGIEADDDMYALSIMVQWIWRSAIRDGDEIYLYIPSRRMRNLLENWIEETVQEEIQSMKHKCNNCVYKENCSEATPCEDFYPLDGDLLTDDVVERIVEDGRSEFESAWREYINEFNN